jgi:hypothetical protein
MPEKSRWREALLYGVGMSPMVEETTAFRADERKELMSPIRLRRNWTYGTSSSALLVLKAASHLKLDDMEMIYYLPHMIDHLVM